MPRRRSGLACRRQRVRVVSHLPPRALVVLRVPHGAAAPSESDLRRAIELDRVRLVLPPTNAFTVRVAGPYTITIGGQTLDEYVAWEA